MLIIFTVEYDFVGFPRVKWLRLTGEVWLICKMFMSNFLGISHTKNKSLKSVDFWQSYSKINRRTFFGTCSYLVSEQWTERPSHLRYFPYGVRSGVVRNEDKKEESRRKGDLGQIGHDGRLVQTTEHHQRTSQEVHLYCKQTAVDWFRCTRQFDVTRSNQKQQQVCV